MEQKFCLMPNCNKPVLSCITNYCCSTHQRSHAGAKGGNAAKGQPKCKYGSEKPAKPLLVSKPKRTKEQYIAYHRQWSIAKQKRTKYAKPSWADDKAIRLIYEKAVHLTIVTGIKHEVDHIVPLTNKLVCGLHVENNLQVITFTENRQKSNKFVID